MAGYRKELFQKLFLDEEKLEENVGIIGEIAGLWNERKRLLAEIFTKKLYEKMKNKRYLYDGTCVYKKLDTNVTLMFCWYDQQGKKRYYFEFLDENKPISNTLGNKLQKILTESQIRPITEDARVDDTVWKEWKGGEDNFVYLVKNIDECVRKVARVLGEIERAYNNNDK